ncbi:uncharacterized protein LOC119583850 [Penaeus monodon]|uniref:uncharacterized protein LOC119583850 n=1 Tax=Penaeus monodon TaxID=6687 RepID=UPI0018A7BEE6|nr:uncharacterized protein LOC119583850 [Penaeus monodon]
MRAVLLAAGYGTRLDRDLRNDESGLYTHLIGVPKPLLPIGQHPLLSHWIHIFKQCSAISTIVVVVNELHKELYKKWAASLGTKVSIVSDGSACNDQRSGAVACMQLGLQEKKEDTLFIAGDTLLKKEFSLDAVIKDFQKLQTNNKGACLILSAPVAEENVSKTGIIELSAKGRVTRFVEKPQPSEIASRIQSPCFYIISREGLQHLEMFLKEKKDKPLMTRDATGTFISELIHRSPVYTYHVSKRYDVGNLQSYIDCHQDFLKETMKSNCRVKQ